MEADKALRARAGKVIPGGMYGHQSAVLLPDGYPQFFTRGSGAHLWDANETKYLDYMCAYGPNLLGYGHKAIDDAYIAQLRLGDTLTGPSPVMVELAEAFVAMIAHADWAMFCKNGTDANSMAMVIARAATGRRKILIAHGAYHGAAPWCTPIKTGTLPEDRAHQIRYDYNDAGQPAGRRGRGRRRPGRHLRHALQARHVHRPAARRSRLCPRGPRRLRRHRRAADRRRRARRLPPVARLQLGAGRRAAGPFILGQGDRQRPSDLVPARATTAPAKRLRASTPPARSGFPPRRWPPRW